MIKTAIDSPRREDDVITIREVLPNYSEISKLFQELYQYLAQQGITKFEYDAGIWQLWLSKSTIAPNISAYLETYE